MKLLQLGKKGMSAQVRRNIESLTKVLGIAATSVEEFTATTDGTVVLTGVATKEQLVNTFNILDNLGYHVFAAEDAIEIVESNRSDVLTTLDKLQAQIEKTAQILMLLATPVRHHKQTKFHRPAETITVVALFDNRQFVIVTRRAPGTEQSGYLAFPGTFVKPWETWREAASRAMLETLGLTIPPSLFQDPEGESLVLEDKRDFVHDSVVCLDVPAHMTQDVKATLKATGDAATAFIWPLVEALDPAAAFAFNHQSSLQIVHRILGHHIGEIEPGVNREVLFQNLAAKGHLTVRKTAKPGKGYYEVQARVVVAPEGEWIETIETRARGEKEFFPAGSVVVTELDGTTYGMDPHTFAGRWQAVDGKLGYHCPKPVDTQAVILKKPLALWTAWGIMQGTSGDALLRYDRGNFAILARSKFGTYEGADADSAKVWNLMRVVAATANVKRTFIGDHMNAIVSADIDAEVKLTIDQISVAPEEISIEVPDGIVLKSREGNELVLLADPVSKEFGISDGIVTINAGSNYAAIYITFGDDGRSYQS